MQNIIVRLQDLASRYIPLKFLAQPRIERGSPEFESRLVLIVEEAQISDLDHRNGLINDAEYGKRCKKLRSQLEFLYGPNLVDLQ